jgi:hypothetical protein
VIIGVSKNNKGEVVEGGRRKGVIRRRGSGKCAVSGTFSVGGSYLSDFC